MTFSEADDEYPFIHHTDEDFDRARELAKSVLRETIAWREVTEQDLAATADLHQFLLAEPYAPWNFQDKAVRQLIRYYFGLGDPD